MEMENQELKTRVILRDGTGVTYGCGGLRHTDKFLRERLEHEHLQEKSTNAIECVIISVAKGQSFKSISEFVDGEKDQPPYLAYCRKPTPIQEACIARYNGVVQLFNATEERDNLKLINDFIAGMADDEVETPI